MNKNEYRIPIVFSTRMLPREITKTITEDEVSMALLQKQRLFVRMYDSDSSQGMRFFVNDPHQPHAYISKLEKTQNGWFATVILPEHTQSRIMFGTYMNPVIYPAVMTNSEDVSILLKDSEPSYFYRLLFFKLYDMNMIDKDRVYNGCHYPARLRNDLNDDETEFILEGVMDNE